MEGGGGAGGHRHALWEHLPLLLQSSSKESVEYILQMLWRTRNTGLDAADRGILRGMLQLESDADIDPLLACLRMLMRKCVQENFKKDDVAKLFPDEVSPELQRLLTLLLQKFLPEWEADVTKEKASLPRLKAMTCNMSNQRTESDVKVAIIDMKLQKDTESLFREKEVKFQVTKDVFETWLKSLYLVRDQLSNTDDHLNEHEQPQETSM